MHPCSWTFKCASAPHLCSCTSVLLLPLADLPPQEEDEEAAVPPHFTPQQEAPDPATLHFIPTRTPSLEAALRLAAELAPGQQIRRAIPPNPSKSMAKWSVYVSGMDVAAVSGNLSEDGWQPLHVAASKATSRERDGTSHSVCCCRRTTRASSMPGLAGWTGSGRRWRPTLWRCGAAVGMRVGRYVPRRRGV